MNGNSSNGDRNRDLEDVTEEYPESKHGTEGQAAHGYEQVGPNSDQAGKPQAPQTGDPRAKDRRPN